MSSTKIYNLRFFFFFSQKIIKLIPNFCEDLEYGRDGTGTLYQSENSDSFSERLLTNDSEKATVKSMDVADPGHELNCDNVTKRYSSVIDSAAFPEVDDQSDYKFKTWNESNMPKTDASSKSDEELYEKCDTPIADITSQNEIVEGSCSGSLDAVEPLSSEVDVVNDRVKVREGNFSGYGKHRDGTNIDIIYRVKTVVLNEKTHYCVWVSRDPWELAEGGRNIHTNLTLTSSFNSTSLEVSLTKDVSVSEQKTLS